MTGLFTFVSPQASIVNLGGYKSDLFDLNVSVHQLCARTMASASVASSGAGDAAAGAAFEDAKNAVVGLYAKWDEVFHR